MAKVVVQVLPDSVLFTFADTETLELKFFFRLDVFDKALDPRSRANTGVGFDAVSEPDHGTLRVDDAVFEVGRKRRGLNIAEKILNPGAIERMDD
ncbi:MAG TPA: hypothetical protein VFT72_13900 [Opitutaceae bacterium]|nr:hypothetical protein [Opitutaceae bacterium]